MKTTVVYFVQQGMVGPIKIGVSTEDDVPRRLKQLQCGNPDELRIIGCYPADHDHEAFLHRIHGRHCIRGEWFHPHPEVLSSASFARGIMRNRQRRAREEAVAR